MVFIRKMSLLKLRRRNKELNNAGPGTRSDELALEPRRPATIALLTVGVLYLTLPVSIAVVSRWLPLALGFALFVPTLITLRRGQHSVNHIFGIIILAMLTLFMVSSLALDARAVLHDLERPAVLLRSAVTLWTMNVIVFASWYWRLDAGVPCFMVTGGEPFSFRR